MGLRSTGVSRGGGEAWRAARSTRKKDSKPRGVAGLCSLLDESHQRGGDNMAPKAHGERHIWGPG